MRRNKRGNRTELRLWMDTTDYEYFRFIADQKEVTVNDLLRGLFAGVVQSLKDSLTEQEIQLVENNIKLIWNYKKIKDIDDANKWLEEHWFSKSGKRIKSQVPK